MEEGEMMIKEDGGITISKNETEINVEEVACLGEHEVVHMSITDSKNISEHAYWFFFFFCKRKAKILRSNLSYNIQLLNETINNNNNKKTHK